MPALNPLRTALVATVSAVAISSAFAENQTVETMLPVHYSAFMDRKKIGPAKYFNKSFGVSAILPVKQDPKISQFAFNDTQADPSLMLDDMVHAFTATLNTPLPAHKVIVAVGPNPAKPTDFVTTLVGRAPSDNRTDALQFEGKPVAFLFCTETQGQALSYGAVDYTGETIARSASAYPQLPESPSGAFVYACKQVLRGATQEYAENYKKYFQEKYKKPLE